MTNPFAVQMFATQLRMLLQQEGCSADELEDLFRQRWGVPFSEDQEASLQTALIEVTGQSRHLEELRPAAILRRKTAKDDHSTATTVRRTFSTWGDTPCCLLLFDVHLD